MLQQRLSATNKAIIKKQYGEAQVTRETDTAASDTLKEQSYSHAAPVLPQYDVTRGQLLSLVTFLPQSFSQCDHKIKHQANINRGTALGT